MRTSPSLPELPAVTCNPGLRTKSVLSLKLVLNDLRMHLGDDALDTILILCANSNLDTLIQSLFIGSIPGRLWLRHYYNRYSYFERMAFRTMIDLAEIQNSEKIIVSHLNWLNQPNSTQVYFLF